jgi:membrane fusion protein (multidrug efflux system)
MADRGGKEGERHGDDQDRSDREDDKDKGDAGKDGGEKDKEGKKDDKKKDDDKKDDGKGQKRRWPIIVLIAATVLVVIGGVVYWFTTRNEETTDDAYTEGNAVAIAPHVSGYVVERRVDDNAFVRTGDLMLLIDQRDYIDSRDQTRANLDLVRAQLQSARSTCKSPACATPRTVSRPRRS